MLATMLRRPRSAYIHSQRGLHVERPAGGGGTLGPAGASPHRAAARARVSGSERALCDGPAKSTPWEEGRGKPEASGLLFVTMGASREGVLWLLCSAGGLGSPPRVPRSWPGAGGQAPHSWPQAWDNIPGHPDCRQLPWGPNRDARHFSQGSPTLGAEQGGARGGRGCQVGSRVRTPSLLTPLPGLGLRGRERVPDGAPIPGTSFLCLLLRPAAPGDFPKSLLLPWTAWLTGVSPLLPCHLLTPCPSPLGLGCLQGPAGCPVQEGGTSLRGYYSPYPSFCFSAPHFPAPPA